MQRSIKLITCSPACSDVNKDLVWHNIIRPGMFKIVQQNNARREVVKILSYRAINKRNMSQELHSSVFKPRHITQWAIFFSASIGP